MSTSKKLLVAMSVLTKLKFNGFLNRECVWDYMRLIRFVTPLVQKVFRINGFRKSTEKIFL